MEVGTVQCQSTWHWYTGGTLGILLTHFLFSCGSGHQANFFLVKMEIDIVQSFSTWRWYSRGTTLGILLTHFLFGSEAPFSLEPRLSGPLGMPPLSRSDHLPDAPDAFFFYHVASTFVFFNRRLLLSVLPSPLSSLERSATTSLTCKAPSPLRHRPFPPRIQAQGSQDSSLPCLCLPRPWLVSSLARLSKATKRLRWLGWSFYLPDWDGLGSRGELSRGTSFGRADLFELLEESPSWRCSDEGETTSRHWGVVA